MTESKPPNPTLPLTIDLSEFFSFADYCKHLREEYGLKPAGPLEFDEEGRAWLPVVRVGEGEGL